MAKRFNLPEEKGSFPHKFTKVENFDYVGKVPNNEFYLNFGEHSLSDNTLEYLSERRNVGTPWSFSEELMKYCILDVTLLQKGCQLYLEQNFEFQKKLIDRFGYQNPQNKLPLIHAFTNPYVTLASFSYACMRAYGMNKVRNKMFTVMGRLMI